MIKLKEMNFNGLVNEIRHLNLLFLDYDDGASDVNITNRLYFMLKNL